MYNRLLKQWIKKASTYYPIVSITGPRQSGKTTLVRETFPQHHYVSLEDPDIFDFAHHDPRGFLETYSSGVILDEIQRAPALFSYLQGIVDRHEQLGQFILTGSQQFLLNEKISQTLAGRTALLRLLPLSLSELLSRTQQSLWTEHRLEKSDEPGCHWWQLAFKGFYPRVHKQNIPAEKFYRDYVDTYVTRDVQSLIKVGDLAKFHTFLRLVAGRCGQKVNLSSLGNDIGLDHTTIRRWLTVLEASYIIHQLPPHFKNFNKRLIKTPKIYFLDPGLLCYLLRIDKAGDVQNHGLVGGIFETLIYSELTKSFTHNDRQAPLYFWQDQTGNEIDILIDQGSGLLPVEIKSSQTLSGHFFDNINNWLNLKNNPQTQGYLLYGGNQWIKRSNVQTIPWYGVS